MIFMQSLDGNFFTNITQAVTTAAASSPTAAHNASLKPQYFTRTGIDAYWLSQIRARDARDKVRAQALAKTLPTCPASSVTSQGYCYRGNAPMPVAPPGVVSVSGVPWHIGEMADKALMKVFTPVDDDHRLNLEYQMIKRSAVDLNRLSEVANLSVADAQRKVPRFMTSANNFKHQPIQPTMEEFTQPNGLRKWLDRGGFPLSRDVIDGKHPTSKHKLGFRYCTTILCNCNGMPSCIDGWVKAGSGETPDWVEWISVDQQAPFKWRQTLLNVDETARDKFGNVIEKLFTKLGNALCSVRGQAEAQVNKLQADVCATANGVTCAKGTAGCSCIPAPAETQAAVGVTNAYMSSWCEGWAKQQQQTVWEPPQPLPPTNVAALPPGSITVFDSNAKLWRVATPITGQFGGDELAAVTHQEQVPQIQQPVTAGVVSSYEFRARTGQLRWYEKWQTWAGIGAGVVAVSGAGYVVYRRRHKA